MEIRKVSVGVLNMAAYNPRKDLQPEDPQYQSLQRSLSEFGYIDPIIWNEQTGNVVGGHQRLKVLIEQGREEVEVSVVNLDEVKEKALNLALNKISGEWDEDLLTDMLVELTGEGLLEFTGFDTVEVSEIVGDGDPDDEPEGITGNDSAFNYHEQYGVIVMCDGEAEQQRIYEDLTGQGYECKVVAT